MPAPSVGTPGPQLSIVIPAFNEADHIYNNLEQVAQTLGDLAFEIVVVDDGSSDATFGECRRAQVDGLPVQVVRQPANEGKGAALIHGVEHAAGERVAFLDADLEIAPHYLLRMMEVLEDTGADVVIGTREGSANRFPLARRALSRTYRWLIPWLFGLPLRETQAGMKLFRREVLIACLPRLSAKRFALDVELLAAVQRFGYRIVECPVQTDYRRQGRMGRLTPWQAAGLLLETLSIYYRASFWCWLQPGRLTKLWMVGLGVGLLLAGIGLGKLLTPLVLYGPVKQAFYVLALQFLPRDLRDWLLVVVGLVLAVVSIVQLNKSLLDAFARLDRGDLAGIYRRRLANHGPAGRPRPGDAP